MEYDTRVGDSIQKFIDCKYALGNVSEGYDCVNSLLEFYSAMGVELPREFEGWTSENYGERALKNPGAGHKEWAKYLLTLGHEVDKNYVARGDLILFAAENVDICAGIYLGNGNVFIMFALGGRVCPYSVFERKDYIKQVRRLL